MKRIPCLLILLLLGGCALLHSSPKPAAAPVTIAYEELVTKIDNDEDFLLYIGRSDCQDCLEFNA